MAPVLIYFPIITFINQIVIATIKVKIAAYQRKVIKVMMPLKKMAVNNNTSNSNIVRFQNEHDADDYVRSFNASSAFGGRKTNRCNSIPFEHVGVNIGNGNHKGRKV